MPDQALSTLYHPLRLSSSYCLSLSSYGELGTFLKTRGDFGGLEVCRFGVFAMAVLGATANAKVVAIMEIFFIIENSPL